MATRATTSITGWAIYLGVSWTWCIGMYLPVILARDFGIWSFAAFALPNAFGAAAMAFVLGDADRSRRLIERHRGAMTSFSFVTIAYQAFFAGWMLPQLLGWWTLGLYPLLLAVLIYAVRKDGEFHKITAAAWALSLAAAALLWQRGALALPDSTGLFTPADGGLGVAWLAPVCLLGFALCPYLDLTFHHALQRAEAGRGWERSKGLLGGARAAYTLGFLGVFASMIALTLLYTPLLLSGHDRLARALVGAHMMLQLVVTIVLHQVRMATAQRNPADSLKTQKRFFPLVAACVALGLLCLFIPPLTGLSTDRPAGEWVYRTFLAYYGLLAPAYVLIRVVSGGTMRLLGGTVVTALPFYAIGFFTPHSVYLVPGVGIVLAGSILARLQQGKLAGLGN